MSVGFIPARIFLSTPSARRATAASPRTTSPRSYFYPRPLRGGRRRRWSGRAPWSDFYPRPLRGGRPSGPGGPFRNSRISIHALCEEGDPVDSVELAGKEISIHALCEEGDRQGQSAELDRSDFYPRPLRGGRQSWSAASEAIFKFLSTPSARRATERLLRASQALAISIHALCEEGDRQPLGYKRGADGFLSTPSARRATYRHRQPDRLWSISIHALCEEGDYAGKLIDQRQAEFLSTPSARRATIASTAGSLTTSDFYPRPLRGGRLLYPVEGDGLVAISIHALCEEGDHPTAPA